MGGEIVIKRLYDYEIVAGTMDAMWDDISEDGVERYTPDLLGEIWLGCFCEGKYLGMFRFHNKTSQCLEGHIFFLKEGRDKSIECGVLVRDWIFENTSATKIIVCIPEIYKNVISYVENLGFEMEGYNKKSFLKNKEVIGMYYYGLSKGCANG